jgi:hypothetical protein
MTQELRRAVPRLPADWIGFYRFDDEKDQRWRCCRVIDVSPLGAGLELLDTSPDERMDGSITISLELHGDVQHLATNENNNSTRVGVTFPAPTEVAHEYVQTLSGSRW